MDLAAQLIEQTADPARGKGERVRRRCRLAKRGEEAGEDENARGGAEGSGESSSSRDEGGHAKEFRAPAKLEGVCFKDEIRRYERFLIERALEETGGGVTRAAHLLGFKHHYSLIALLNHRHKNLLSARAPVVPRKRSIIRGDDDPRRAADKNAPHDTDMDDEEDE